LHFAPHDIIVTEASEDWVGQRWLVAHQGQKVDAPLSRTNSFRHLRIIIINIITVEWKSHNERA